MTGNKKEDLTGKDRFIWNTFVSWSSHLVLVVSGFIMPRLMEQELGQELLGSWDFCWTFINYLKFAGLGVGNGSNRYVAKFRAEGDFKALNKLVSSVIIVQAFVALALSIATLVIVYIIPIYFVEQLAENLSSVQQVTFYLGLSLAINMLFSATRGVLTGYHRWDLHNSLTALYSVLSVAFMLIILLSGFGIVGMAQAYLFITILFEVIRIYVTKYYCKGISVSFSLASKKQCWDLIGFSSKNKLTTLPPVFITQSVNMMIVSSLSISALAIFARSLALTRHVTTFMSKFSMMLTPSTGSMLAESQKEELKLFYLTTTKLSFAFTLPMVIILALYGDLIILAWMGPQYVDQKMTIILALGVLLPTAQDCSLRILMGMNIHGKISAYLIVIVLAVFSLFYYFFNGENLSLPIAALAIVLPLNIANGIVLPIYTCNKLGVKFFSYVKFSIIVPVIAVAPFACSLFLSRSLFEQNLLIYALLSFIVGTAILCLSYGYFLLNAKQRLQLYKKIKEAEA